jgi:hypothetical protein
VNPFMNRCSPTAANQALTQLLQGRLQAIILREATSKRTSLEEEIKFLTELAKRCRAYLGQPELGAYESILEFVNASPQKTAFNRKSSRRKRNGLIPPRRVEDMLTPTDIFKSIAADILPEEAKSLADHAKKARLQGDSGIATSPAFNLASRRTTSSEETQKYLVEYIIHQLCEPALESHRASLAAYSEVLGTYNGPLFQAH